MTDYNIIIGLDRPSSRIVWYTEYRDWPKMIPSDPHISVYNWYGSSNVTPLELNNFGVVNIDGRLLRSEPNLDDLPKLNLIRKKCKICWRWLTQLNQMYNSTCSYLPNIPLGKPNSNDRKLFLEEQQKVADMISIEIANYHHLIWMASTEEELDGLVEKIYDNVSFQQAW
jgi:hypothetical protein